VQASSEMIVADVVVRLPDEVDLHARPAADFVRTAMRFPCQVWVAAGEREVDAKSLLSVLALGAKGGTSLRLRANGAEAPAALEALAATLAGLN
jgi:phosphocarrier protein HPr